MISIVPPRLHCCSSTTWPTTVALVLALLLSCRLLEEAQPVLERASTSGKGVQLKAMAVEALSLMVFVGVEDPAVLDSAMTHMMGLWKGADPPFQGFSGLFTLYAAL